MSALEQFSVAPAVTEQAGQVTALAQGSVPRQVANPGDNVNLCSPCCCLIVLFRPAHP